MEGEEVRRSKAWAGVAGTKQIGSLCHPVSPDFAQLQLRNCAKSGDLSKPKFFARTVNT
jgi:hypothetical protein